MKYELSATYRDFLLRRDTAVAFMLSLLALFYVVKLLSIANLQFYPTIYRVTYTSSFNESITGSFFADNMIMLGLGLLVISLIVKYRTHAIASSAVIFTMALVTGIVYSSLFAEAASLATIPSIVTLIVLNKTFARNLLSRHIHLQTLAISTLVIVLAFEVLTLLRWASYPLLPSKLYNDWTWTAATLDSKIFYVFGLASPFVMVLMVFAFLIKPFLKDVRSSIASKIPVLRISSHGIEANSNSIAYQTRKDSGIFSRRSIHRWLLAASFALALLFSVYPYLPSVNPDFQVVSVDVDYYTRWLSQLQNTDSSDSLLHKAFADVNDGDRPLSLLLMLGIQSLTGISSEIIVRFLPLVLGPMLVGAVYYFVKFGTSNKNIAALSALVTVVSFQFVVGMYAGFLANWLALVSSYLSLLFLLRAWKEPNKLHYLAFLSLTTLTLFIHVYTWGYLIASIVLFLVISYVIHRKERGKIIKIGILGAMVATTIAIDLARTSYLGAAGGLEKDLVIVQTGSGIQQFLLRWNNLQYTFQDYVGGFFTNAAILILALIWVLKARYNNSFDRILLASIFVGALPLISGNFGMQTRILYDMPIHIPAALMLYSIINNYSMHPVLSSVLSSAIIVHFFNYALRSMANLYLIPP